MQTTEPTTRRPFHETIIDAIRSANSTEFQCLAKLIKATKIPKGHDEIIAAWNQKLDNMTAFWFKGDLGVPADLLEQKQEAAEKEKEKSKEQTGTVCS